MFTEAPKRTRPRDPGRRRATEREIQGLAFVAKAQPVTTGAYQRYLGMSQAVARRSLRKLRDLGLVTVHVIAMELPSRFVLGSGAPTLLASSLGRAPQEFHIPRGIGKVHLDHHDGSVDCYIFFSRALALIKDLELDEFLFEDEIRRALGGARGVQVPDAVAVFRRPADGARRALAIEIDRATENPNWVARRKGLPYAELQRSGAPLRGCPDWRVACVTATPRRRNQLIRALWDAGVPEGLWYFATDATLDQKNILGAGWVTARLALGGTVAEVAETSPLEGVLAGCELREHRPEEKISLEKIGLADEEKRE